VDGLDPAGVEEDSFRTRGFTRIDVRLDKLLVHRSSITPTAKAEGKTNSNSDIPNPRQSSHFSGIHLCENFLLRDDVWLLRTVKKRHQPSKKRVVN